MKVLYIILAILFFGIIIFIHELGHFLFARKFGVTILEFSIGMGPRIISWKSKKYETRYSLRAFPIGGFVAMEGESEESEDENSFHKKPVYQRMIITVAGALVNIIAGLLVMMVLVSTTDTLYSTTIDNFVAIEGVKSTESQGLMVGDEIVRINNRNVYVANDVQYELMREGINPVDITVIRNGERILIEDVFLPQIEEDGTLFGDRDFNFRAEDKNIINTLKHSVVRSFSTVRMIYDSIYDLITGRYSISGVSGPVGVTKVITEAASYGFSNFLYIIAFISINIGIVNLLPLPALDGGRIIFLIIELIRRKPLPIKFENYINMGGLAILIILSVIITVKDIFQLF